MHQYQYHQSVICYDQLWPVMCLSAFHRMSADSFSCAGLDMCYSAIYQSASGQSVCQSATCNGPVAACLVSVCILPRSRSSANRQSVVCRIKVVSPSPVSRQSVIGQSSVYHMSVVRISCVTDVSGLLPYVSRQAESKQQSINCQSAKCHMSLCSLPGLSRQSVILHSAV